MRQVNNAAAEKPHGSVRIYPASPSDRIQIRFLQGLLFGKNYCDGEWYRKSKSAYLSSLHHALQNYQANCMLASQVVMSLLVVHSVSSIEQQTDQQLTSQQPQLQHAFKDDEAMTQVAS